ncbi:LysR family transcriptional regulator [Limimaricola pyoseonensis]|uniref:DNA-binding transcriptional regulator, LysR family n=1 Tax=Limimaricola pyoseonensis TaxID=521013 RepID=A0A1G7CC90_9RHOB|nr:LysR family transcriptional regulator [Limimaricola pyoseonensis]SDE36911.1 DNA-binding transcriptional regulator, LysR family [Limimaricola pyoseonensis]
MDSRYLETFIMVAECGSIAEAARRLNLTPAALAQRLRALEADIGQSLVVRSGRTVQPTAAGLAILDRARMLVAGTRDLRAIAGQGRPAGQLRLGATATAMTGILPGVIADLSARHPAIEYFVQPGASVDLYHRLIEEHLDAAILVEPNFPLPKSVDWLAMRHEPLVLLAPAERAGETLADLVSGARFIRYDRNQWGGQIVDRYLRENGLQVREWLELDALDAIAAMVDRGLGFSIVPDWGAPWPEGLRVEKTVLEGCEARRTGVLWRRSTARLAAVEAFVDSCRQVAVPVS